MNRETQAEQDRENPQPTGHKANDAFDDLPLPAIEMDSSGVVTRANRATLALHPPERGKLVGKMVWDFMAADEKDPSFAAYCESIETGAAPEMVRRSLYDRSGSFRTYDLHRRMIHDESGTPAGMRVIFVDVTDQVKALEAAHRTRLWLESILESVCEAVIVTDSVGFIREANPAALKLLGANHGELAGMLIEDGMPVASYTSSDRTSLHFTCSLESPSKGRATVLDRTQKEIEVEVSTSPIFEKETGSTIGVVYVLRVI
jgi:PAS domain S-box-containing protein